MNTEVKTKTRESEEMYLETILLLRQKKAHVRSVDIAEELGYAKSSVSRGVNLLIDRGYIAPDREGNLILTASGEERAANIYERHRVLTEAFLLLGATKEIAEKNACRIEHVITEELFEIVKNHVAENTKRNSEIKTCKNLEIF